MGMDVMRYSVVRTISVEEFNPIFSEDGYCDLMDNFHKIKVDERTKNWLNKVELNTDHIRFEKEFDWETWIENHPEYENHKYIDYVIHGDDPHWIHLESPDGESILLDKTNAVFPYRDNVFIFVEAKEIGYMRKPFRHSDAPVIQQGDAIVLTVTNFSDKGRDGFGELKKIDPVQTEEANVYVFDKSQLQKLKQYSYDPKYFKEAFMDNWEYNHYVLFNW